MKKIAMALISASACAYGSASTVANGEINPVAATLSGVYASAGLGHGKTDFSKSDTASLFAAGEELKNKAMTWAVGAGYRFNPYVALDFAYVSLPSVKNGSDKILNKVSSIDMAMKGSLPVADLVTLYGKAGAAYTRYHVASDLPNSVTAVTVGDNKTVQAGDKVKGFAPLVGAGIEYKINQAVTAGLGMDYGFERGKIPSRYTAGASISYIF